MEKLYVSGGGGGLEAEADASNGDDTVCFAYVKLIH